MSKQLTYHKLVEENKSLRKKLKQRAEILNSNLLGNIMTSSIEISVAATDIDLNIIFFNPKAEQIFGYKASEVIGKNLTEIHTMENVAFSRIENAIEIVKKHKKYEYYVNTKNKFVGFVLFTEDISTRIIAEEVLNKSEEQYRIITGNSLQSIFQVNANRHIVYANMGDKPKIISDTKSLFN